MTYQDGAFCETLEAIRRRLSDLRAVLDSGCYNQTESTHINYLNRTHHKSSHVKHSHHHKSYKSKKPHHHHHHLHVHHDCLHRLKIKNNKDKSSHKKYYTDKIGRRLYARAIPIEKDYLMSNIEISRLMKKSNGKSVLSSNEIPKKQKTPILFPFEEINLKNSELSSNSYYYDDIYSEYEYNDDDDNEYYSNNNCGKDLTRNHGNSSKSNKKQIVYLKTYQTQEKSKESKSNPATFQEKGKIIYFDTQIDESDENALFYASDINQKGLSHVQNQQINKIRKDNVKSHKLDPIVPISNEKESKLKQSKKSKINKSKKERISTKDDENLVIQERKVNINYEIIQSNNREENEEDFNIQKSIKKKDRNSSINGEKSKKIKTNNEIRLTSKQIHHQNKLVQSKNKKIDPNLSIKKEEKYDIQKLFTIKMCIKNQPICIAIGDIEGDVKKLHHIFNLIKANPSLNFVFIGDIIDDISDASPLAEENWKCLSLLSEFFVGKNQLSFKTDDNKNIDIKSNGQPVSLPSAFNEIRFEKKNFDEIRSRVKFIAGNAECDALSDIRESCEIVRGDVTKYVFGKGKWKKTVTFEKMCLLYQYFKNCYGIIELKRARPNNASKNDKFIDTVYFRHSPSTFKDTNSVVSQIPDLNESEVTKGNFIFVTGHIRQFVNGLSSNPEAQAFIIDTSSKKYQKKVDDDDDDILPSDNRLAVVSFDNNTGFSVESFALPSEFPKTIKL